MKIFVSKAYQKWRETVKDPVASEPIDKFLCRVFLADDIKNVTPSPKAVGKDMSKLPTVVDEFSVGRRSRVYSKCFRTQTGEYAFYVASAGSKSTKAQRADIITAVSFFNDFNPEECIAWEPSADLIATVLVQAYRTVDDAPSGAASSDDAPVAVPEQKPQKKKGKPVDENGLTPAARKAMRKAEQEEKRKQAQAAAKQKRAQAKAAEDTRSKQAQEFAVATMVTALSTLVVGQTPVNNLVSVPGIKDVADAAVAVKPESATQPAVTLNGAPVSAPEPITKAPEFHDVADVQYQLELIEHKMKVERLQIEVARQKIVIAEREIALENLEMEKLRLKMSQAQKTQKSQK